MCYYKAHLYIHDLGIKEFYAAVDPIKKAGFIVEFLHAPKASLRSRSHGKRGLHEFSLSPKASLRMLERTGAGGLGSSLEG